MLELKEGGPHWPGLKPSPPPEPPGEGADAGGSTRGWTITRMITF